MESGGNRGSVRTIFNSVRPSVKTSRFANLQEHTEMNGKTSDEQTDGQT